MNDNNENLKLKITENLRESVQMQHNAKSLYLKKIF